MNMYNEALAMKDTLTADRRHFHQNPELGLELPHGPLRDVLRPAYWLYDSHGRRRACIRFQI